MNLEIVQFHGCCGACSIYLLDSEDSLYTIPDLKNALNKAKKEYSVALVIMNEDQKPSLEKHILKLGFKRNWGPIKNINKTDMRLYGYHINLNKFGPEKKKLKKRKFS